jgi:hypothetical protein
MSVVPNRVSLLVVALLATAFSVSGQREEKTLFGFDSDGSLILDDGGSKAWFVRA